MKITDLYTSYQLITSVLLVILWYVPEANATGAPATAADTLMAAGWGWGSLMVSIMSMAWQKWSNTSMKGQHVAVLMFHASQLPTALVQPGGPHYDTHQALLAQIAEAQKQITAEAGTAADTSSNNLAIGLIVLAGVFGGTLLVSWIVFSVVLRFLQPKHQLPRPTPLQRRLMRVSPEFAMLYLKAVEEATTPAPSAPSSTSLALEDSILVNLVAALATLAGSAAESVANIASGVAKNAYSVYPLAITASAVMVGGNLFVQYTDSIVPVVRDAWQCNIRPLIVDYIALPVTLVAFVLIPLMTYGFSIFLARVMNILQWGWARVILTFAFFALGIYANGLAAALSGFILSIVQWVEQGVLTTAYPATHFLEPLFAFVTLFFNTAILPTCEILNYLIGGIGAAFARPELALAVGAAINFPIYALQELLFQLIFFQQTPLVSGFNDLTITMLDNTATWLENVTVIQFDIWIGQDIIGMVNGTVPMPTDGLEYLIRFLQSDWAHVPAFIVTGAAALVWETLRIAFYTNDWFSLNGANFWTFEMLRVSLVSFFNALGSMVNTLPNCSVDSAPEYSASQNIKFGQLVSGGGRAIVAAGYIGMNLGFNEFYSLINGNFPGYASAAYFAKNGSMLNEYAYQNNNFSQALGCTIALLDPGIGNFVQGLWNVVFLYGIQVPIYFVSYARVAIQTSQPGILNLLDQGPNAPVAQLEREALKISGIAELIYRFQNANSQICTTNLGFFCSLGKALEKGVEAIIRAYILLLKSGINIVRFFLILLTTGSPGAVVPLDITGFVSAVYMMGCRLLTAVSNVIPFQLECLSATPNICAVFEFNPVPSPQTPTICMSTFACKVGKYIGVVPDVIFTLLQFGNQILWSLSNPTENFTDASTKALVFVLRTFMNIFVNKIASPLCPFAHYLDCWLDVVVPGLNMPISKLFCLVNSFLISFITIVGDTIISIVQLIMYAIQILFGGADVGTITAFITQFFTVIGTSLYKIVMAIIGLIFQIFVTILEGVCKYLICLIPGDVCNACNEAVAAMKGQAKSLLDPNNNSNYLLNKKKRDAAGSFSTTNVTQMSDDLKWAFGLLYNETYYNTTDGTSVTVTYERLIDPEWWYTHLATKVVWTVGTDCWRLLKAYNGTAKSNIPHGDVVWMDQCVSDKGFRIVLINTVSWLAWLPEDIFYNPMRRWIVAAQTLRYVAVVLEWLLDRKSAPDIVMSLQYQSGWSALALNTSHYTNEFASVYPGPNQSEVAYAPFNMYRDNLTLSWYEQRNMPYHQNWFSTNATGLDYALTLAEASQTAYLSFSDWMYGTLAGQYNYSNLVVSSQNIQNSISGVDPVTNMSMSDGSMYSIYNVYTVNNQSNVRSTIFELYGDAGVNAYDSQQSAAGLWAALHTLFLSLFNFVDEAKVTYGYGNSSIFFHDYLNNNNYLQSDNSTLTNTNSTVPPMAPNQAPPSAQKRSVSSFYEERFPKPTITAEHLKRAQTIEKAQRKLFDSGRANKNSTWVIRHIWEGVKKGYAESVDHFMVNNGVAKLILEPSPSDKKRGLFTHKTVLETNNVPKTRGQRVLVAAVAGYATNLNLSTTYVPKWCDNVTVSSPDTLKDLCNTSNWRHALGVLLQGENGTFTQIDEHAQNFTESLFNETSQIVTNMFKARSPKAELARVFTYSVGEAVLQFGQELYTATANEMSAEDIHLAVQRVIDKRRAAADELLERRTVVFDANFARQSASQAAQQRSTSSRAPRETYLESVERSKRWKEAFVGSATGKDLFVFDMGNTSSQNFNQWVSFVNEEHLLDPVGMRMAVPGQLDQPASKFYTKATESGVGFMGAVGRAFVRTLDEQTLISTDQENYKSLFKPTVPEHPESSLLSTEVITDNYIMRVRSLTKRRELFELVTGKTAPSDKKLVPPVEIRTYQEAYMRKTPQWGTRINAAGVSEKTALPPKYELVFASNFFRPKEKEQALVSALLEEKRLHEQIVAQNNAGNVSVLAATVPTLELRKNVQEIRILPLRANSAKSFGVDQVLAAASGSSQKVSSQFFFPTDQAETINLARQVLGCKLGSQWLCQNCILIDYYVGTILQLILTLVSYYTKYFPVAFITSSQWLSYGYNATATVQIGYGQFPPRWPSRTTATPYWYRGLTREVQNYPAHSGPEWTWFVEDRIGVPLPATLYLNGTYNTQFQAYLAAEAAALPGFTPSALWGTYKIINSAIGWNIPAILDTIFKFVEDHWSEISTAAYDSWRCNYTTHLDCSIRTYSFVGGATLLLTSYLYIIGFLAVFAGSGTAASVALVLFALFPYLHSYITYGAAFGCFPWLPQCYVTDMWTALAYFEFPKCSPIWGAFITSTNYDLNSCTTCKGTFGIGKLFYNSSATSANDFTYINCANYGFGNAYDGFTVARWYSEAIGNTAGWILTGGETVLNAIYDFGAAILGPSYGRPAPTRNWSSAAVQNNWRESDAAYAAYYACAIPTATYGTAEATLFLLGGYIAAVPLLQAVGTLILSLFAVLGSVLAFLRISAINAPMLLEIYLAQRFLEHDLSDEKLKKSMFAPYLRAMQNKDPADKNADLDDGSDERIEQELGDERTPAEREEDEVLDGFENNKLYKQAQAATAPMRRAAFFPAMRRARNDVWNTVQRFFRG